MMMFMYAPKHINRQFLSDKINVIIIGKIKYPARCMSAMEGQSAWSSAKALYHITLVGRGLLTHWTTDSW